MVNFFEANHCDQSGNQSAEEVPQTKIAQVVSDRPSGEKVGDSCSRDLQNSTWDRFRHLDSFHIK